MDIDPLDAERLYVVLRDHLQAWRSPSTHWVGIASGGAWIASRLQKDWALEKIGIISSSMHRDDHLRRTSRSLHKTGYGSARESTDLPFDVSGADIVLLDDVLYTGRTIRAVLNELFDYGRPASVRLAVLVDRGGRELPLQADFSALKSDMTAQQSLRLSWLEDGRFVFEKS